MSDPYFRSDGDQFADEAVVQAYRHRPPIAEVVFDRLLGLIVDPPRVVLDAGCGTGPVARTLAEHVDRVDAIDPSSAMLREGGRLARGAPNIRWVLGRMEDAPLDPPYALIVAAGSLHWMDLDVVLPRFGAALTPRGRVALVYQRQLDAPWSTEQSEIVRVYSTNQDPHQYRIVQRAAEKGLVVEEDWSSPPIPFVQSVSSYVESIHSRSGWSRARMTPEAGAEMDARLHALLEGHARDGTLELQIVYRCVTGRIAP